MSDRIVELPAARKFEGSVIEEPAVAGPDWGAIARSAWNHRGRLAAGAVVGVALAVALSFVLPPTYVANVALLEAPRPGGGSALDQLGLQAEMLGIKSGGGSNALTYPDILRSRRLVTTLLEAKYTDQKGASIKLIDHVMGGTPSPQRSELAVDEILELGPTHRLCTALQHGLTHAMMTQASANRKFIEERLAGAERELAGAEASLRSFRESNLHVDSPRLVLEQARLAREMRVREEVVIALSRQYEIARVDENRDVPVLNVMDPAVVPAFRSSPKRAPMALAGLLLGVAVAAAASTEQWRRIRALGLPSSPAATEAKAA